MVPPIMARAELHRMSRRISTPAAAFMLFCILSVCCSSGANGSYLKGDPASPGVDGADDDVLIITAKSDLKKLFECSRLHPVGSFNEYFVTCGLRKTSGKPLPRRVQLHNVHIHAADVYAEASTTHVELELLLNASTAANTTVELTKSSIETSAVRVEACRVTVDADSVVNVTASGLKFGPGYNSWFNMGSSYGGLGGAALDGMLHPKCDNLPPLKFYRAIGSIDGDSSNFQGYGSGGGNDRGRGGGRVDIHAAQELVLNGSLLANGGPADNESSDSAGSGGTILVVAGHITASSGAIQANGGAPVEYDRTNDSGGGGGGGGGRIALRFKKLDELNATQLQAYGGGVVSKAFDDGVATGNNIQWCQLGGDGSILKVQMGTSAAAEEATVPLLVASLVIKGRRVDHSAPTKPAQIYGCTPLFYQTSRGDPFVPEYVAQLFVTGGASLCASYLVLQPNVSTTNSSIIIESGSSISSLDRNRTVLLGATHVSLQCYVGPPSQNVHDSFSFLLTGSDITLANAQVAVDQLIISAASTIVIDKFSVVKFRSRVSLTALSSDIQVLGFLEPDAADDDDGDDGNNLRVGDIGGRDGIDPFVDVAAKSGSVLFTPQAAQIGVLSVELHAAEDMTVDLPFETPFLSLLARANNLVVVRLTGGAIHKCTAIESHASTSTCADLGNGHDFQGWTSPPSYQLSLKATTTLTLGNITSGSILACSDGLISVEGRVTADGLGCAANTGPGASSIVDGASGGAGHGGKGGNVEPSNTGGGKVYDFPPSEVWPLTDEVPSAWPIWPGSGAAAGDGSGGIAGGSGGGLIYIGARQLILTKALSTISARGAIGTKSGGGGAGGAIAVFVGELQGSGRIDVAGGDSQPSTTFLLGMDSANTNGTSVWQQVTKDPAQDQATPGGGGGGGGIIRTFFRGDEAGTTGNGDSFIHSGGVLVVSGGKGLGGEVGADGIVAAVNCSSGRGGGVCQQCQPGSFSPGNASRCLPCEPGTFADKEGQGSCRKCAAGSWNPDFGKKTCELCAVGTFAKTDGAKACVPCAAGSFANKTGTTVCPLCPLGTVSVTAGNVNCTLCGIGETTLHTGSLHCAQCTHKPDHAAFNVRGQCTYACEKGRNGLDCLTPFERFIKPIGGPLGFAILLLSFTCVVFGSWGFITYRSNADQKFNKRFTQYKAQTQRDEQSFANLTKNLTPRLTDHDLVGHVTRMYFCGDNHLFSSWVLDPYGMPNELKELVRDEDAFVTFCQSCNQRVAWPEHGGWEAYVHRLLLVVVPPLATAFLRKRQLSRVESLAKHITHYTGGFVRELGFRRHGAQLKVGFSPDFSLAYFDVIAPTASSSGGSSAMSPSRARLPDRLPSTVMTNMLIAVAGSGSFFRPYHIDTNDVLVRAVPARLELLQHQFWIDFIAELNQRLRLLQQPSASHTRQERVGEALQELLQFVTAFNQQRHESADGILVRFGTLVSTTHFQQLEADMVQMRLEESATEPFKFALLVTKKSGRHITPSPLRGPTAMIHGGPLDSVDVYEPLADTTTTTSDEDPRPIEFRYSQIRMEALFSLPPSAEDNDESLLQPLYPDKLHPRRRSSLSHVAMTSASDLLLCSPHSATFQWLAVLFRPLAPTFRLRNLRPWTRTHQWPWIFPFLMVLLLIGDCVVAFWVLMEFYCIQVDDPTAHDTGCSRVAFITVLSVLPLAITCAPLLGLVFLTRKSVFYGKLFALWALGSVVNLLVALLCGVIYLNYIKETVLIVIASGLVLKVLEKEVALQCIAQYTVERPLRGWRGLHTTKDWYDAAYTPLIHHER